MFACSLSFHFITQIHSQFVEPIFVVNIASICRKLGKDGGTKLDEFSEKFQRGGGSYSIQKFMLQILGTLTGLFEHEIDTKE